MPNSNNNEPNSKEIGQPSGKREPNPSKIVGGRYLILKELGQGGFAKTYLAQDLEATDNSQCVIKQLQPNLTKPEIWQDAKRRFAKEGLIQQRLGQHERIPRFLDNFTENQEFYLVQEFIEGEELGKEIERQRLNEDRVIFLLEDVLKILDFVHKTNVIHRDLKPSNLIRRKSDGKFVLIDFGAVKEIGTLALNSQGQTVFTKVIGTQGFMPSEQMAGHPTFSSDIYALGKTAIYALTGRSPLELEREQEGMLPNWSKFCQVSPHLEAIINKMIAPKPIERYPGAIAVLQDLQPLLKIGKTLGGRYRVREYLGGKKGIYTYLADNLWRHYQSPCVVKEIQLRYSDSATWQTAEHLFAKELAVLERLSSHPQMPQLWDHFEENEAFYLVEEYIAGENLADKLKDNPQLEEEEVIALLKSTLEALAVIHQHHTIHRDIKPSNLIIRSSDRQVVPIDFGILKDIAHIYLASTGLTQQVGTEAYMPPEQIAGRPTLGSDIYALGITAIQALTGIKPEEFQSDRQTGAIIWRKDLQVNRRLAKILDKMVDPYLGKRYQSTDEVLDDLNRIIRSSTTISLEIEDKAQDSKDNYPANITYVAPVSDVNPLSTVNWLKPHYILIALLGVGVLLTSIELLFPIVRPFYYSYQGKQALSDEPETALATFEQAIELQAKNASAWIGKGDALYSLERYSDALEAYDRSIRLQRNNAIAWRGRGDALYRLERFTAALSSFDKALQLRSKDANTLNRRGRALYQLERYQEALASQQQALKLEPNNAQALSDLGIASIGLGKFQDALAAFNRAQVLEPLDPRFWQNKALALQYLHQPQEAIRVYQEALVAYNQVLKERPEDVIAWLERGNVLSKLQQHEEALAAYDKVIGIRPESHLAWLGKGNTLFALRQYDQALAAFDRALEIQPESYITWHNRGSLLQDAMRNLSRAIASYDKAVAINPSFYHAWRDRGFALSQSGQQSEAIKSFKKALQINPKDYKAWVGWGIALSFLDQIDEALATFERAQEIQPNDPFVWMNKGSALEKGGRYNEACDAYREVKKLNPGFSPAIQALQRLGCRMP
jgi:serine/threonine protein kinase